MTRILYAAILVVLVFSSPARAIITNRYIVTDIGLTPDAAYHGTAWRINNYGQVTGNIVTSLGYRAFLWTPAVPNSATGSFVTPETLPDTLYSYGIGINSQGQVVGTSQEINGRRRGFLWTPDTANNSVGSTNDVGDLFLGSFGETVAWAVNSFGQVVGRSDVSRTEHAFLWQPTAANATTGTIIDLGTLGGSNSIARDINSLGQIIGESRSGQRGPLRAFLWTPDAPNQSSGSMVNIGDLPGGSDRSSAWGINSYGQVVGDSDATDGQRAFLWSPNEPNGGSGEMIDLGVLPEFDERSSAQAINSMGQAVGNSFGSSEFRAFVWLPDTDNGTSGAMHDLNALLDPISGEGWTLRAAYDINDTGQIIGGGWYDPDGPGGVFRKARPFLLTPIRIPEPSSILLALLLVAFLALYLGARSNCLRLTMSQSHE